MHGHELGHEGHGAEHGPGHDDNKIPAFVAAILSVQLALVSLGGHRAHTEAILMQAKATDQWAYYQSSRIKLSTQEDVAESVGELLRQLAGKDGAVAPERSAKYEEKSRSKVKKYQEKSEEIKAQAEELEHKVHRAEEKANYFDIGEIFLEVAIVLCSLTFLTRRSLFWKAATVSGAIGLVVAMLSFMPH